MKGDQHLKIKILLHDFRAGFKWRTGNTYTSLVFFLLPEVVHKSFPMVLQHRSSNLQLQFHLKNYVCVPTGELKDTEAACAISVEGYELAWH
jgi:hypothetical protein